MDSQYSINIMISNKPELDENKEIFILVSKVTFAQNWFGINLLVGGGKGSSLRCLFVFCFLFLLLEKLSLLDSQLFLVLFSSYSHPYPSGARIE